MSEAEHIPVTFFGYTDIVWSAVPCGAWVKQANEPEPGDEILGAPGWLRHTSYGFGATQAEAAADLLKRRGVTPSRFKEDGESQRAFRWTAFFDYDRKMEKGTWEEVRQFLRDAINNIGGTDHVFLETVEIEGERDGAPIYSLGLGS
jgi:hypothetical protein